MTRLLIVTVLLATVAVVLALRNRKGVATRSLKVTARAGLSRCQFRPATVDGKPEQAWASMRYTWRLE